MNENSYIYRQVSRCIWVEKTKPFPQIPIEKTAKQYFFSFSTSCMGFCVSHVRAKNNVSHTWDAWQHFRDVLLQLLSVFTHLFSSSKLVLKPRQKTPKLKKYQILKKSNIKSSGGSCPQLQYVNLSLHIPLS